MDERPQFRVELLRLSDGVVVVAAEGEVDIYTAPRLKDALDQAFQDGAMRLIVDLTMVPFIDSTGLGVLVSEFRAAHARGAGIDIVCDRPNVVRIFKVTGLLGVFGFFASRTEALAAAPDMAG
jgi:anti-sigma B factor antagonist